MKKTLLSFSSLLPILTLLFLFVFHFIAYYRIKDNGLMEDEHYHYTRIQNFMHGNFSLNDELQMLPGYHYVIAYISEFLGITPYGYYDAVGLVRFVSLVISLSSIVFFFFLAQELDQKHSLIKTVQYAFFPLTFTFFPLLYTDVVALGTLFACYFFMRKKHFVIASIIAVFSTYVRQNNILWIGVFFLIEYFENNGWHFSKKRILQYPLSYLVILAPTALIGYVYLTFGRLVIGSINDARPTHGTLVPNNLFMMLFISNFLFLPLVLSKLKQGVVFIIHHKIFTALLIFFAIYLLPYFRIEHIYNYGDFFIHNAILGYFTKSTVHKIIFFTGVIVAVIVLFVTKLLKKEYYLLYPFSVLFMMTLIFIEQRYYIVPLTLFLLYRKTEKKWVEIGITLCFLVISLYIYNGISHWWLFP